MKDFFDRMFRELGQAPREDVKLLMLLLTMATGLIFGLALAETVR